MDIVLLGDAHLWPVLWQRLPAAKNDAYHAAAEVFEYARANDFPIISSGDLLNCGEKGGLSDVLQFLSSIMGDLDFNWISGNHDMPGYTSGAANPPWLYIFSGVKGWNGHHLSATSHELTSEAPYVKVAGIDYQHGRSRFMEKLNEVKKAGKVDILVIHQGMREWLSYEGAWECEFDDFVEDVADVVICGHTHICTDTEHKGTLFISPGSTVPWRLDEDLEKRFPVLSINKDSVKVKWQTIKSYRDIYSMTVTCKEEAATLLQMLKDYVPREGLNPELAAPIVRLKYMPSEEWYPAIVQLCEQRGFNLMADPFQVSLGQINLGAFEKKDSDADEIDIATKKHTSPGKVRDAATEIQRTKDPEGVLDKYLQEIGKE